MKTILIPLLVFLALSITIRGQADGHKWRSLTTTPQLLWVDATQLDTISAAEFEIWIVELHKPAVTIDGISGKVNRTKTLYTVSRTENKFGIKKVVYYNNANKEIWHYDYQPADISNGLKYCFPINKNSFLEKIFESIDKRSGK